MGFAIPSSPIGPLLRKILKEALASVESEQAVYRSVKKRGHLLLVGSHRYDLRRYDRIAVVGAGKATAPMARAIERVLGSRLHGGMVIVKYGHSVPTERIVVEEASHPVPDRAGLGAAKRLRSFVASLTDRDLLIVLLSGGASSLMPAPVRGVSLADKQRITRQLLRSGAGIREINSVRKHLSDLKGGRLAESTDATVLTLILSDVLGDDLSAIASGPTAPDPTTYSQAVQCLKRYKIWARAPKTVRNHLERGKRGEISETPKARSAVFRRVHNQIIGNNRFALHSVAQNARRAGLRPFLVSATLTGEARIVGARFGRLARNILDQRRPVRTPCCVMAGGETTVTVRGKGKGGRAQEFAVATALAIAGLPHVYVAAFGTDGTDGPTDAAGAFVDGKTAARAQKLGVNLETALARNDTYPALRRLRSHIMTGPTGTNVNDLYLLFVL